MLISATEVKAMSRFSTYDESLIERKLKKIEYAIRAYTHNLFLSATIRFYTKIADNQIILDTDLLAANDTILIKNFYINDFFTIKENSDGAITINEGELHNSPKSLIAKVIYPFDVVEGALDILEWEFKMRGKVGIKQETISRHSLTYFDMDSNNTVNGYPVSLFSFLSPYVKGRT